MRARSQRGSAVVEAVIGAPVILLLLVTLIGAARVAVAHQAVDNAAGDAARAASAERRSADAGAAAVAAAGTSLRGRGFSCSPMALQVDASQWHPGGVVVVTLSCTAQLADLGIPAFGGSRTISARAVSTIDVYRELSP